MTLTDMTEILKLKEFSSHLWGLNRQAHGAFFIAFHPFSQVTIPGIRLQWETALSFTTRSLGIEPGSCSRQALDVMEEDDATRATGQSWTQLNSKTRFEVEYGHSTKRYTPLLIFMELLFNRIEDQKWRIVNEKSNWRLVLLRWYGVAYISAALVQLDVIWYTHLYSVSILLIHKSMDDKLLHPFWMGCFVNEHDLYQLILQYPQTKSNSNSSNPWLNGVLRLNSYRWWPLNTADLTLTALRCFCKSAREAPSVYPSRFHSIGTPPTRLDWSDTRCSTAGRKSTILNTATVVI